MADIDSIYEGQIWRPPSEAYSLILQATVGCSWNRCTFCMAYRDKTFRIKSQSEIRRDVETVLPAYRDVERIFLADGNALLIPTDDLVSILELLYSSFPKLKRVTLYGGPQDIRDKTHDELIRLRDAGLGMVYLGLESGSRKVLKKVRKGAGPEMMVRAGQKMKRVGIPLSAIVILGLGGQELSREHAEQTGKVLTRMQPAYIGCLTLMIYKGCEIEKEQNEGRLTLLEPHQVFDELEIMVENLLFSDETVFRANHASNYQPLRATLPAQKDRLLEKIRSLRESGQFKPEFMRAL